MKKLLMLALVLTISYGASAQRKTEIVETTVNTVKDDGMVLKRKVAIGRFSNETQYAFSRPNLLLRASSYCSNAVIWRLF